MSDYRTMTNSHERKPYVRPVLTVKGDVAVLTQSWQGKTLGSGDSFILSITNNDPGPIASIINSVTHLS
jgi:hypothetical protein